MTPQLMMMPLHAKFSYKSLSGSEDITWTKSRHTKMWTHAQRFQYTPLPNFVRGGITFFVLILFLRTFIVSTLLQASSYSSLTASALAAVDAMLAPGTVDCRTAELNLENQRKVFSSQQMLLLQIQTMHNISNT